MRKFIILYQPFTRISYVTDIGVTSSSILDANTEDEKLVDFYKDKKNYTVLYFDSPEGKEFILKEQGRNTAKINALQWELTQRREFNSKLINLFYDNNK